MHNHQTMAAAAKKAVFPLVSVVALATPGIALAEADFSPLIDAVDWAAVGIGIVTVMAAGAGIVVIFMGAKMLVKAIRGAA